MGYGVSNDHMTDKIRRPENVKIVSQIYLDANILKRQEIEDQFRWTTIRNWPMSNRLVTQSMTSHGIGQTPCSYERYLVMYKLTRRDDAMDVVVMARRKGTGPGGGQDEGPEWLSCRGPEIWSYVTVRHYVFCSQYVVKIQSTFVKIISQSILKSFFYICIL